MGRNRSSRTKPSLALLGALLLAGCTGREQAPPQRSYSQLESERIDLHPITDRGRAAMGEGLDDAPEGPVSQRISVSKLEYGKKEPVHVTLLWLNNTNQPIRVSRRLFLGANFDVLLFLNDEVRVLPSVKPDPPMTPLRPADFVVLPPFGEHSEVLNLKDLPRFGLARGQRDKWYYDLTRPGSYKLRISTRSIPYQLYPEELQGDPTAHKWEGSTLTNVVEFKVRRR